MGCFDTLKIPCPYCNQWFEEQTKPGYMNYYVFGEDPDDDFSFEGFYTCPHCQKNFSIDMEVKPRMIINKIEE